MKFLHSVLYNLGRHPEYVEPLRKEAEQYDAADFANTDEEMPLLDSFLKETARLMPPPLFTYFRKAMVDYTFADGTFVPAGNSVGMPQCVTMLDENLWKNPNEFQGFRHVPDPSKAVPGGAHRFTHTGDDWPFWGSKRQAW